jgi:hypothetical protein
MVVKFIDLPDNKQLLASIKPYLISINGYPFFNPVNPYPVH